MSKDAKYIESCLEKLANGDYSFDMSGNILKKNNSAGKMARLIKIIVENECSRSEQLEMIANGNFDAAPQTRLDIHTDASVKKLVTAYKDINSQINGVVDAFNSGDKSARIDESDLKGDFRNAGAKLNSALDAASITSGKIQSAIKAMSEGNFALRINDDCPGISHDLMSEINKLNEKLKLIASLSAKAADGDFSDSEAIENIKAQCGGDAIISSIIKVGDNLSLLKEQIDGSGTNEALTGAYKDIAESVRDVLSSNSDSVKEILDMLSAMSVNDLTVTFSGDLTDGFAEIAKYVEELRNHLLFIKTMAQEVSHGDLTNIEKIKSIGKLSENDELTPAFSELVLNIQSIIKETSEMAKAVESGDLMYRMDTDSVTGQYTAIFESFNSAFDALSMPVIEMSAVLESLATGNTRKTVTGDFSGVFETLKNDVNIIIQSTKELVDMITETLTKVSEGNLNISKLKELNGDWNGVPTALNKIVDSLNILIGNIYNAVDEVTAGANQVSIGSQELSQGATEQASSIEELTSSIAEIASQTKLNAQNASKASTLAKTMRDNAISGNEAMREMLTSMQEINESSRNISKIIKVIDDIAFQTNILALNAAVEAARAGENGKGFAVVAEEVRNLAARSANAAKDTTSLIEGSIDRVEKGTKIAATTAKTLGNIVDGVDKVAGLVENIAVASNEQATGITQVNQGLEQVSKVVQTNSATAEESAAASEELSGQASMLKSSVQKFTLRDDAKHIAVTKNDNADAKAASNRNRPKKNIDLDINFGKY